MVLSGVNQPFVADCDFPPERADDDYLITPKEPRARRNFRSEIRLSEEAQALFEPPI